MPLPPPVTMATLPASFILLNPPAHPTTAGLTTSGLHRAPLDGCRRRRGSHLELPIVQRHAVEIALGPRRPGSGECRHSDERPEIVGPARTWHQALQRAPCTSAGVPRAHAGSVQAGSYPA